MEDGSILIKRVDVYRVHCHNTSSAVRTFTPVNPTEEVVRTFRPVNPLPDEKIIVRVAARLGEALLEGWGEGAPGDPSFTGQTAEIAANDVERRIAPSIIGQGFKSADDIFALIGQASNLRLEMGCALAAIDNALFDLLGKMENCPVFMILRRHLGLRRLKREDFPIFYT
jgi:L-alanine-DL-glutamate epimerase-like enolase superfamily enzyme